MIPGGYIKFNSTCGFPQKQIENVGGFIQAKLMCYRRSRSTAVQPRTGKAGPPPPRFKSISGRSQSTQQVFCTDFISVGFLQLLPSLAEGNETRFTFQQSCTVVLYQIQKVQRATHDRRRAYLAVFSSSASAHFRLCISEPSVLCLSLDSCI